MGTECTQFVFGFHPLKHREIRAQFDGGAITTEGGGLLLREVEKRIGIVRQFAACFRDYRNPDLIEHTVEELVLIDGFGGGEASGRGSLSSGMVAFPPFRPGFTSAAGIRIPSSDCGWPKGCRQTRTPDLPRQQT